MTPDDDLPNFAKINESLFRGGQPTVRGLEHLAQIGVRTVVNLRDTPSAVVRERRAVEKLGMNFRNIRLSNWFQARDAEIRAIVEVIDDPANQPVFIHCKRGADRTGTVIAIYRMLIDGWNDRDANREAKRYGIGWWQVWMREHIKGYYRRNLKK